MYTTSSCHTSKKTHVIHIWFKIHTSAAYTNIMLLDTLEQVRASKNIVVTDTLKQESLLVNHTYDPTV